ncbi:MAG: lipopolysaccharide transport system permease protein [Alteromonas naphthalenivorans]|jgi:lipopolysaccharide transport system permease protein
MKYRVITPRYTWKELFTELWDYRDIFLFLGWRDVLVHYKQTVIGIAWVVLRPLLTVAIFTIIFSRIAGIESSIAPYPLIVFSAMLAWQFFVDMLTYASNSFLSNEQLVSKVYFPRIILPASRILCSSVDFIVSFIFYLILSLVRYQFIPPKQIILFPLFFGWLVLVSLSISLLFASLIVRYRDFRHIVPFVTQLGLYCTSVGFSLSMVPKSLVLFLGLNPLVGIINGFRWTLLGEPLHIEVMLVSLGVTIIFSIISLWYFKIAQDTFADAL